MVLTLKRWKSRSSPGIVASELGNNPFTSQRADPHGPALLASLGRQTGAAGWSSPVARQAHNLKVVGSNPTPATIRSITYRTRASPLTGGAFVVSGAVVPMAVTAMRLYLSVRQRHL